MRRRSRASRFVQGPRASSRPRRVRNGSRRCARSSDPDSSCRRGSERREGTPARQSPRGPTRSSSVAQSTKPRIRSRPRRESQTKSAPSHRVSLIPSHFVRVPRRVRCGQRLRDSLIRPWSTAVYAVQVDRMSAGTGVGGAGDGLGGVADLWELSDAGFPPARMTSDQVLAMVSQGRVGLASQVRRVSEAQSTRTVSRPEFGYAFPYLNLPSQKLKGKHMPEVVGFVAINPNLARALDVARQLAADPKARNFGFWYSAHLDWIPAPLVRRARLFQMWNGVWVAPLVESSTVKPGTWLNVHLLAFNLTDKDQHRSLRAGGSEIAAGMRGNLSFSLPPWSWAIQMVSVPAQGPPGEHTLSFKTRSGAERAATAAAVGILTLGSFVYAPGSSGFSLRYQILPPESAKSVEAWEAYALQAAGKRFEDAHASAISDRQGGRIPKETVLERFRPYLTPSLIFAALQAKQRPPEQVFPTLLDEFLFDWLGYRGADQAFLAE